MRCLIQRVTGASVKVDDCVVGAIETGLVALVCGMAGDSEDAASRLATKVAKLRIFRDRNGKMNRSVQDVNGSILVVSQFTLAADTSRGNRPGFSTAASPESARKQYEQFISSLKKLGIETASGIFGAEMQVALTNDGPVTIWIERS